ncbi:hypothetical protein QBC38DRAFT_452274 [Podospora fimiseda]|uniref:Nephrocystin 3-like N-terminal domain-containing protein n=1 Tax=Podospora fimiseda TaxID=252190 RepID=A0AAN7BVK9_9PEZI|nr:hypothetical protein QBC38DRAFT_452274 [Podospora fimiseda]
MLGLRKTFTSRRLSKRASSSSVSSDPVKDEASSVASDPVKEETADTPSRPSMETIRAGLQESSAGLAIKGYVQKPSEVTTVTTTSIDQQDDGSVASGGDDYSAVSAIQHSPISSENLHVSRVFEVSRDVQAKICKLGEYNESFFSSVDLQSYLEYISDERLIHMPRRGSAWDRVLRSAQFFGLQLARLGINVARYCPEAEVASITALASTQILLEIGPQQAQALVPTFQALYELGLLVSYVSQIHEVFRASREIKENVAHLYCDLVALVGRISALYREKITNLGNSGSVSINFERAFGSSMSKIYERRDSITAKMWALKLGHSTSGLSLQSVRKRLQNDRSAKGAFYDQVSETIKRTEGTCEWFKTPLVDFFRGNEKALTVTGDTGSGKTVLAGWIKERLQRPLDHRQYATLTYSFPYDYPARCTVLAFLKSVLYQLLERNVGDVLLFKKLSGAFEAYDKHHNTAKLEASLWEALESGFRSLDDRQSHLAIVVDGFGEITGGPTTQEFHKKLRDIIAKFKTIRLITLSRAISHLSDGCSHFTITAQHLHRDLRSYFNLSFSKFTCFSQLSSEAKEKVAHELTHKAKSSFLWAYLVVRLLSKDAPTMSPDAFVKAAHAITGGLEDILKKVVSKLSLKHEFVQTLLSFILAAERPLDVNELAELLRLNLQSRKFGTDIDLVANINSTCGDIVIVENGSVHFKSKSVRVYLQTLMGKTLPSPQDAHRTLTLALLLYAKLTLQHVSVPSFDLLDDRSVEDYFSTHRLLAYSIKRWQLHLRQSSFYSAKGDLTLSKDFIEVFPTSCHFALLERSSLHDLHGSDRCKHHEFSLKVQEKCLGEKHELVLQTLIILGNLHSADGLTAAHFFYRAASLGKVVLSVNNAVVATCTHYFLQYTETITITKRTELVTYREEMILLMIEICKAKHGSHSDQVIRWYKVLAKLYVDIREDFRATVIHKLLLEIIVIRFGKHSDEYRGITEYIGGLDIELRGGPKVEHPQEYVDFFFEASDGYQDFADERRVSILLKLALFYVSQKQFFYAEKIYITLWKRISELCRLNATLELHITKIKIAIEYVRFLKEIGRGHEAANILICLWVEYEHHTFDDKSIILLIRDVGVLFRSFGLLKVAIDVLTKVWGWFKSKGNVTDKDAGETTILITEVVEEVIETTRDVRIITDTTTEVTETVSREVFITHYERCKKSKADSAFLTSCLALINFYLKLGKFGQAEIVIKQSLEITWKAILTADVSIKLSEHFISECIAIATRLAICYRGQHHFEKAEAIYLRIFRSCLVSLDIQDIRIQETLALLVSFYEEHHRHEKVIEIYIELLGEYRKRLGHTHQLTIKTLYLLAGHCELIGRVEAYRYYLEIVETLNKGRKHCHHDAFQAAVILVRYYHETQKWRELQLICSVLWETFIHCHHEITFTEEIVQLIYEKYIYVLEFHAKVDISVLYEISIKYRETVTVVFGASADIVILAMIALAGICEKHEKHHHEAVTIYEEVITRTTTTKTITKTITIETITTVKKRLSKVYVTIITKGGGSTTTTIDRAIELCLEAYAILQVEFGCWHEKTLLKLKEIVILYQKLGKESHHKIVDLIQLAFIEISFANCGSIELYHAGLTLASIYVAAGMAKYGLRLVHQWRHLIIFGRDFESTLDVVVKVDKVISKVALVFLVAFEHCLVEKSVLSYSELMAVTLLEISLYEQYKRVIETETKIEIVLEYGAKLRTFWVEQRQEQMVAILDQRLYHVFKTKYAGCITTHDDYTRIFYLALLGSLGRDLTKIDFPALVCRTGNAKVEALLEAREFKKAFEVAKCTFHFAHKQHFYSDLGRVQYAYKLAEFMAGIDVHKPTDAKLWEEYLKLSKEITTEALTIFKAHNIEFVRLRFKDLSGIVRLLGSQHNYVELEDLLLKLWQSREVQKTWGAARVLSVGRLMVHAHVAANHIPAAIDLCETMCYNLRRSRGVLDPVTVEMFQMLAALYTSDKRVDRCMSIHEQILREIEAALRDEEEWGSSGRSSRLYAGAKTKAQQQQPPEALAKVACSQLELLKRAHYRLDGKWAKPEQEYTALYQRLLARLGKYGLQQAPAPETWDKTAAANKDKPDDVVGKYVGPKEWKLEDDEDHNEPHVHGVNNGGGRERLALTNGGTGTGRLSVDKRRSARWNRNVDFVRVASQEWLII